MRYYDQRSNTVRDIPDCQTFGLQWSGLTQRCENEQTRQRLEKAAKQMGLGFAASSSNDDYYFYDDFGNYWEYGWFDDYFMGGGGGDYYPIDLPFFDTPDFPILLPEPGISAGNPFEGWDNYLSNWLAGLVDVINTADPYALPQGQGDYRLPEFEPYGDISPVLYPGPGPAEIDLSDVLPGYCPRGTYHPISDPMACVPFPASDATAKRRANQQQQQQQQAMRQRRQQQQQQNKQCPRDPQNRPVWRNPKTGKCEIVPSCPQGSRFDQVTGRCLTANQLNAAYGSNNWLWLLLGGGALLLFLTRDNNRSGRRGR